MFYWDPTYVLVLIGAVISMIASMNVNRTFEKYNTFAHSGGRTASDVARIILHSAGIDDVRIEQVRGNLTDHYSPHEKVLRLSEGVCNAQTVAAIGIAAHECGHAIQHRQGYAPLKLRSAAVPIANIGSRLSWPIILLGLIFGYPPIAQAGVLLFVFVVAFQLITLPVEFNASRRAMQILEGEGLLAGDDLSGAGKVLRAAALTYVAALFAAVLQLLRLIAIAGGNRRRD